MNINLEYYKIFYYVGKTGRITLAARELSLSQPAVSQMLKQLERQLGVTLFIRTPKGVRFTKEGRVLYDHISRGYDAIRSGEQMLRKMVNLGSGDIHIGASDMTLQFYLLPYLEIFHKTYPNVKVHITNAPTPETLDNLKEGKIDFGIVSTPFPRQEEITVRPLKEIEDIFIAGDTFRHLDGQQLDYHTLTGLPLICLEPNTSTRKHIDALLAKRGITLHPEFELATSDMIVQFVRRNMGVGYVMKEFAAEYIEDGSIFPLQFTAQNPRRQICLVSASTYPVSLAAGRLMESLKTE